MGGCVGATRLLFSLWLISLLGVGLWLGVGAIVHVGFGVVRLGDLIVFVGMVAGCLCLRQFVGLWFGCGFACGWLRLILCLLGLGLYLFGCLCFWFVFRLIVALVWLIRFSVGFGCAGLVCAWLLFVVGVGYFV